MTGRNREDDFLVEPLFSALRGAEEEPPSPSRRRGWWVLLTVVVIVVIWCVTVGALGGA